MYVCHDDFGIVKAVSDDAIYMDGLATMIVKDKPRSTWARLIGTKIVSTKKPANQLRVAVICNWNQACGISTYSKFLLDALRPKVAEIKIFSEFSSHDKHAVDCWTRGESMRTAIEKVMQWKPDFVLIQHEFGLFPKATHFLTMLQMLDKVPYAVTLHSVYEHLDKTICTSAIRNIIVHSEEAKNILRKIGNDSNIFVIPHGCVEAEDSSELWNIFQTPYCIVQFGFGFFYKGVDIALDAIHRLKEADPEKYSNIFYCYLCSSNSHTDNVHDQYYEFLTQKIKELNLEDNVAIIRKYQTEQTLNHYLRTAKLAIFPYVTDPNNTVYGASGAIRVAMANGIPVIASKSHLFDDLEGVVPRPHNAMSLAVQIDKIFSNGEYRQQLLDANKHFIETNTWENVADRYLDVQKKII